MKSDLVTTDLRDGYRLLTLNKPDRLNSFSAAMHGKGMTAFVEKRALRFVGRQ